MCTKLGKTEKEVMMDVKNKSIFSFPCAFAAGFLRSITRNEANIKPKVKHTAWVLKDNLKFASVVVAGGGGSCCRPSRFV